MQPANVKGKKEKFFFVKEEFGVGCANAVIKRKIHGSDARKLFLVIMINGLSVVYAGGWNKIWKICTSFNLNRSLERLRYLHQMNKREKIESWRLQHTAHNQCARFAHKLCMLIRSRIRDSISQKVLFTLLLRTIFE